MFFQIRPGVDRFPTAPFRRCVLEPCARALSVKVVFLHDPLKSFALRATDDVDEIARLKLRDAQIDLAFRRISFQAKLAQKFFGLGAGLFEVTESCCVTRDSFAIQNRPGPRIAVVFRRYPAQQNVIPAAITVTGRIRPFAS
jgi:hypothetical protein